MPKLSALIGLIATCSVFFAEPVFAQSTLDKEVELTEQKGSAAELLFHIEQRSGIIFSYSNKVCLPQRVVFQQKKASVKYFLDHIFETCQVDYKVIDNKIMIVPIPKNEQRFRVRGFVRDSLNGEALIGANVFDVYGSQGVATNDRGFFSITLTGGEVVVGSSYIGFNTRFHRFDLGSDTTLVFNLEPQPELQEIPIIGMRRVSGVYSTQTSTIEVPLTQIQNVPSFMGEVDLIKSLQQFPGVQSGNEGFSGLYVRGGGADQNLILIDGVPVYNVEHLLGFFSIFNADAVNKVSLIKGGFPAQYGGRLSSVLDIHTFDGSSSKQNGSVSLGLLSSKVSLNGPVVKDKSKYFLSFRRTYYDILAAPLLINREDKSFYYFFDLNGKFTHRFSPRSELTLSSYWGRDDLLSKYNFKNVARSIVEGDEDNIKLNDEVGTGWGNIVGSLKWRYVINNRMFASLSGAYSNYHYVSKQTESTDSEDDWITYTRKYSSGIRDASLKLDIDYMPSNNHSIKFGVSGVLHRFYPGIDVLQSTLSSDEKNDTTLGGKMMSGTEIRGYFQEEFNVSPSLKLNAGVHFSTYNTEGRSYSSLEPRLNLRYLLTPTVSVKGSYSVMRQYLHVLNATNLSLPSDLWLPVTDKIKPLEAWQVDFGPEWEISEGFMLTLDAYYKEIKNVLDYSENQSFFDFSQGWESKLTSGSGRSYGLELLLHRKIGALSGWFGYTWSKSISRFDELNNGKSFRSNNDRRHDVSAFVSYRFSDRFDAGITWAYGSGKPVNLPNEMYYVPDMPTSLQQYSGYQESYSSKNGYSMPDFHRMDIGVNFYRDVKMGRRIWSVGVMNVYGRQNPFFLYFSESEKDGATVRSLKQFSLFPIPFPYVRYTIKF
ncbi:MAG: TonB-dependent receptor plug domain-containing protein [Breznakibacter sp.]